VPEALLCIYALIDPAQPEQHRYIGVAWNLSLRLDGHVREATFRGSSSRKCRWIRRLVSEGRMPEAVVLYRDMPREAALQLESILIDRLRSAGQSLLNVDPGGRAGRRGSHHVNGRRAARRVLRKWVQGLSHCSTCGATGHNSRGHALSWVLCPT
jgi:hypothetical protein